MLVRAGVLLLVGCSTPATVCGALSTEACDAVHAMLLPDALPPARGNRYGDDLAAAQLGFRLFFDSDVGTGVACVACHAPESAFANRTSVSVGKAAGVRNAPTIFNAARLSVFFWDGRADSLWSQPLFAIENPVEMGSSRTELAQLMRRDDLRPDYDQVFGPLPDATAWPATGKPGDAQFDALPVGVQSDINRVAANVGKALEAYMRKNVAGPAALDAYLRGDPSRLIPAAQRGLVAFAANKCTDCHRGPLLTDESFHDVGFPSLPGAAADLGHATGAGVLQNNPFNLAGPYADDAPPAVPVTASAGFRTPSLRNVARTAPYGHDGALATLSDVLRLHAPGLSDDDRGNIIAFFQTLNGDIPPLPWSNWPSAQ